MNASSVSFLDVLQGDSAIIDLPGNYFGVVDFGDQAAGTTVVKPAIQARIAKGHIFLFGAITHFDDDHAGGLAEILAACPPKYVLLSWIAFDLIEEWVRHLQSEATLKSIQALNDAVAAKRVKRVRLSNNAFFTLGEIPGVRIFALSPDAQFEDELREVLKSSSRTVPASSQLSRMRNRSSMALYLDFVGAESMVLLAEVESDQYSCMWQVIAEFVRGDYKSPTVVKLSHHGSRHNNPEEVFHYFGDPGVLMVTSAGGRHGHPDVVIMEQVRSIGALPACTNLGAGCNLLMTLPVLPTDISTWRTSNKSLLKKAPPGRPKCYGTIRISFKGPSDTLAEFASVQKICPFNGPALQSLAIANARTA